jgi:hypothetical protein
MTKPLLTQNLLRTNMKRILILPLFILTMHVAVAQFAPPVGQPGTTAMYRDSTAFIAWATGCKVVRGYQDISNPSGGYPTVGDSTSAIGKANGSSIVSLGDGGSAVVTFKLPIKNENGYDFAIFENSFSDTFLELAFVEVSSDGITYFRFPATSNTQDTLQLDNGANMDARKINNLAGKYRASYGTPFDLQELAGTSGLDINNITHVKIIDVVGSILPAYATHDINGKKINDPWSTPFASSGFDLDAVGVIHQVSPNSIEDPVSEIAFNVFPNPVSNTSKIQLMLGVPQTVTIDVLDLMGRQVAVVADRISPQQTDLISMEEIHLQNGIYFLRINGVHTTTTEKIVFINEH